MSALNVQHIAKLANLTLTQKEIKLYSKQFESILNYVNQLDKINTSSVKPTYQVLDKTVNITRIDKPKKSLTQKQALSQAKKTYQGYFVADNVFQKTNLKSKKPIFKLHLKFDKFNAVLTKVNKKGSVGHKDLFCTKDIETTAGSNVLIGFKPQYSATVVNKLEQHGLKTKYKLNQDAWGHGSSGENSDFGPTKNPYNLKKVAGGSSSGSGAAVASQMVDLATGTDTCGSIRMPSAYCNLTGIKPTYGAVSRYGVIAFASSLDCPGLMAGSAKNLKKYFKLINHSDPKDATSQSSARSSSKPKPVKTIGLPQEFLSSGIHPDIKKLIKKSADKYQDLGFKIKSISLPNAKYGIAAYYIIAPTEAFSNLSRYDGIRFGQNRKYFGPEAKRRIMLGSFVSSAGYTDKYYQKAAKVRTLIIKDFQKAFQKVDVILSPVTPVPPFQIGAKVNNPLELYLMDIYAAPASLAGLPALSLPCGFINNLPMGMQIIAPRWQENSLFNIAEIYQQNTNHHLKKPNL